MFKKKTSEEVLEEQDIFSEETPVEMMEDTFVPAEVPMLDETQEGGSYSEYDYDGEYENGDSPDEDYDGEYDEEYNEEYDGEYDDEYDDDEYEYYEVRPRTIWHTVAYMFTVLLLALALAVGMWFAADDVLALTKPDVSITITVEPEDTLEDIAQDLKDHGLVNYKFLFLLYGKMSNAEEKIGTGTFDLNQMFDYHALVNGLSATSESRQTVTLTFPEGFSVDQIFAMLAENGVCTLEALEETAANYEFELEFLHGIPYGEANRLEGYLFPDTYEFYVDDEPVRVINKLLNNFEAKFSEEMRAAIETLNVDLRTRMEQEGSFTQEEIDASMMDVYKIITVASLIEKEAGNDAERAAISSVIYNRLTTRVHELLQIDATVEYALGEHKTELTANDLGVDDPYNTYRNKGLPPGPIANPGLSSIMAAIYPDNSDYFFYALNEYGSHNFFNTYMEQQDFLNGTTTATEAAEEAPVEAPAEETETESGAEAETTADGEEPYYQQVITGGDGTEEVINAQ